MTSARRGWAALLLGVVLWGCWSVGAALAQTDVTLPLLGPGTYDADALAFPGSTTTEVVPGAAGAVWQVEGPVTVLVDGTAAQVRWRASLPPTFWIADQVPVSTVFTSPPDADGWQTTSVDLSFVRRGHTLQLRPQTVPLLLDGVSIADNSARNLILATVAAYVIGSLFGALLWALLRRLRVRSAQMP